MTERWIPVVALTAVRDGDVVAVEADGVAMVIAREGEALYALQRRCLHRGGDLADGIISRGHVICANHGWRFAAATGCHDQASDVCLTRYAVRVTGDQIEVDPTPLAASTTNSGETERMDLVDPSEKDEDV
ncbi:MAG TPA: Rieske (2Fe-2S) protein [Kofleriaceae bacterium]|jgi:nitrite reductase (NADH) small subunit